MITNIIYSGLFSKISCLEIHLNDKLHRLAANFNKLSSKLRLSVIKTCQLILLTIRFVYSFIIPGVEWLKTKIIINGVQLLEKSYFTSVVEQTNYQVQANEHMKIKRVEKEIGNTFVYHKLQVLLALGKVKILISGSERSR